MYRALIILLLLGSAFGQSSVGLFQDINGVKYADQFSGGDIGAKINAAYAALPANGGTIFVSPKADNSCYSYTTPIIFQTSGKYAILAGLPAGNQTNPGGGACLNYTPTTATAAITLDYTPAAGGGYMPANGLRDLTLINNSCNTNGGCGSSATGVLTGTTNGGAHMADFRNVKIGGFGTGVNLNETGGIGWAVQFSNFSLAWNTTGLNFGTLHENIHWFGGACAVNGTCAAGNSTASDLFMYSVSVDSNTTAGITGSLNFSCVDCHFENLGSTALNYLNLTGGTASLVGGVYLDDQTTSTIAQMFTLSGTLLHITGASIFSGGRTITNIFTNSGNATVSGDFIATSSAPLPSVCSVGTCSVIKQIVGVVPGWNASGWIETTAPGANTGYDICYGDSTAHAVKCNYNNTTFFAQTQTIGTGNVTTAGTAVNTLTCQAQTGITVTGAATTDNVVANIGAALPATWQTGIVLSAHVTATNTVTVYLCNPTATASITPAATQVNVRVTR